MILVFRSVEADPQRFVQINGLCASKRMNRFPDRWKKEWCSTGCGVPGTGDGGVVIVEILWIRGAR